MELSTVVNNLLECSICQEPFRDPRNLPCGHTFCLQCLEHLVNTTTSNASRNANDFLCSTCRTPWTVPSEGLASLPKNYLAGNILSVQSQPQMQPSTASASAACSSADDGDVHGSGEYFCLECWEPLCATCKDSHKRNKLSRNHEVKLEVEISDSDRQKHNKWKDSRCPNHEKEEAKMYCKECRELVCTTCALVSHRNHPVMEVEETNRMFVNELTKYRQNVRKATDDWSKERDRIGTKLELLQQARATVTKGIDDSFDFAEEQLKIAFNNLVSELRQSKQETRATFEEQVNQSIESAELEHKTSNWELNRCKRSCEMAEEALSSKSSVRKRSQFINHLPAIKHINLSNNPYQNACNMEHYSQDLNLWKNKMTAWLQKEIKCIAEHEPFPAFLLSNGAGGLLTIQHERSDPSPNAQQQQQQPVSHHRQQLSEPQQQLLMSQQQPPVSHQQQPSVSQQQPSVPQRQQQQHHQPYTEQLGLQLQQQQHGQPHQPQHQQQQQRNIGLRLIERGKRLFQRNHRQENRNVSDGFDIEGKT